MWFRRIFHRGSIRLLNWSALVPIAVISSTQYVADPCYCDAENRFVRTSPHQRVSNTFTDLMDWCCKNSIGMNKNAKFATTCTKGLGVYATGGGIATGEAVFHVPFSLLITAENLKDHPPLAGILGALQGSGLDDRGALALWYLYCRSSGDPRRADYIRYMPSRSELVECHPLVMQEALKGSALAAAVDKLRSHIGRQIIFIVKILAQLGLDSSVLFNSARNLEEEWTLCHALVLTRSGIGQTQAGTDWTQQPVCIIPGVDFCNHGGPDSNSRLHFEADGSVTLRATRPIRAEEEITLEYWPSEGPDRLGIEQSLFNFGFPTDCDRFVIPGLVIDADVLTPRTAVQLLLLMDMQQQGTHHQILLDETELAVGYLSIDSMDENEVRELGASYAIEGGMGNAVKQILEGFRAEGERRLLKILQLWRSQISQEIATNQNLTIYHSRLLAAIDSKIGVLTASR